MTVELDTRELLKKWLLSKVTLITFITLVLSIGVYVATLGSAAVWEQVVNALALGMVPTCLIGLIWELSVRSTFLVYADELIRRSISESAIASQHEWASTMMELTSACGPSSVNFKYGLCQGFDDRTAAKLQRVIGAATTRVWIHLTS